MALTRRALLGAGGAAGLAAAAGGGFALGRDSGDDDGSGDDHVVAFHGTHQAGIATPAQDRLHFAAFDVEDGVSAADLRDLLREWTAAGARMSTGRAVGTGA